MPLVVIPGGAAPPDGQPSAGAQGYNGWYPHVEPARPPVIEPLWYTDPQGNVTDFTTIPGEQYKAGLEGRYMPLIQHLSDSVPEVDGDRYRGTRAIPRQLTIGMTYIGEDITEVRARVRAAAAGINPKRGPGTLNVITPDGLERYITCAYESGLESSVDLGGDSNGFSQTVSLSFRAFDPYWYDADETVVTASPGERMSTFFPLTPVRLGTSSVFATWMEPNAGDVAAWPVWTITGPGDSLALVNDTTGDRLDLLQPVPPRYTVTIDTRPGVKTVTDQNGVNLFPYVAGALWPIIAGNNELRVELANAVTATQVRLSYRAGYLGS